MTVRAPFPWFGGKSRVAQVVWERFGDVPNYVEPFAGSLAVLLARPHPPRIETVNDLDCYLANFWRAVQADPDAVADHADWPVNEADLHARHRWLVNDGRAVVDRLRADPDFHDARIAGWWVWGLCAWIGSGWCASPRQQQRNDGVRPDLSADGRGVHAPTAQVPYLSGRGMGVNSPATVGQVPHLADGGRGVHSKQPHLQTEGKGMHRKLPAVARGSARGEHREQIPSPKIPHLGNAGRGDAASSVAPIAEWMHALSERLRRVRVCCGDWARVVTPAVTFNHGITGVLLDPPYSQDEREAVYGVETDVADAVREWAIANGDNPLLRIAICGYEGEHAMPDAWAKVAWKAVGGYGAGRGGRADDNAHRERIWFSPHCLDPRVRQTTLWEAAS